MGQRMAQVVGISANAQWDLCQTALGYSELHRGCGFGDLLNGSNGVEGLLKSS